MRDRLSPTVADPHADGAGKDPAAVADDVVVHGDVAGAGKRPRARPGLRRCARRRRRGRADSSARRGNPGSRGGTRRRSAPTWPISQSCDRDVPRPVGMIAASVAPRLAAVAGGGKTRAAVLERQALERDVLDELAGSGSPAKNHQLGGHRGDDLGLGHVLARQRHVGERAVAAQEPLARRVERGLEALQVKTRAGGPIRETRQFLPRGDDLMLSRLKVVRSRAA